MDATLRRLCAYGYIRIYFSKNQLNVPVDIDIASICVQYLEPGLKWLFSVEDMDQKIILQTHKNSVYHSESIRLIDNEHGMKWESLTLSDQRLLMDILTSSESDHCITEIECSSSTFGVNGTRWISSVLVNCASLQFVNVPGCNLNAEAVQIIVDSLAQNHSLRCPL